MTPDLKQEVADVVSRLSLPQSRNFVARALEEAGLLNRPVVAGALGTDLSKRIKSSDRKWELELVDGSLTASIRAIENDMRLSATRRTVSMSFALLFSVVAVVLIVWAFVHGDANRKIIQLAGTTGLAAVPWAIYGHETKTNESRAKDLAKLTEVRVKYFGSTMRIGSSK